MRDITLGEKIKLAHFIFMKEIWEIKRFPAAMEFQLFIHKYVKSRNIF